MAAPAVPSPAPEQDSSELARRRRLVWRRVAEAGARWRRGLVRGSSAGERRSAVGRARAERRWASRALHRLGEATSHAGAGLGVAAAVAAWVAVGFAVGFPGWWETALYSVSSVVTLVMVFAIQHAQARQQSAIQRKLDEVLRALPQADDRLIAAEEAPDEELEALADLNLEDRERAAAAVEEEAGSLRPSRDLRPVSGAGGAAHGRGTGAPRG